MVPFDWYVWVGTDPRSAVGVDPVAEIPDLRSLPRVVRLKYATRINRWTGLASAANLGSRAGESVLWREVQSRSGVVDVASVAFHDRFGCWGFLDLWGGSPFTARHLCLLTELAPALTRALRGRQADALRERAVVAETTRSAAVVLLQNDLTVSGFTPAAAALLSRLLPQPDGRPAVPAAAYNVAAQLLAVEAGVDCGEPEGRLQVGGHWMTVRASRIDPGGTIAVSLEPMPPHDRLDLCVRAFGLTAREADVVAAVTAGSSSAEIGRDLHLSVHTVQDHLKSVFAKTGVGSRRELVPLLLGPDVRAY